MENQEETQIESFDSAAGESVGQAEEPVNPPEPGTPESAGERRGFIKFLCAFIGTLISAVPFGAGVWSYFDPLAKRNKGGGDGFVMNCHVLVLPCVTQESQERNTERYF